MVADTPLLRFRAVSDVSVTLNIYDIIKHGGIRLCRSYNNIRLVTVIADLKCDTPLANSTNLSFLACFAVSHT